MRAAVSLASGTELPHTFGEWLKCRRKELDLTQAELAERATCTVFALRKIEKDERRPSKQLAGLLARSLEIPEGDQTTFIKVARGEYQMERLSTPAAKPSTAIQLPEPSFLSGGNLPPELSSFVGRSDEMRDLEGLLRDGRHRLLTLTGSGGAGKTRLALKVCSKVIDTFPDGVWLVEFAPLGAPGLVVKTVAQVLGIQEEPDVPILDTLSGYLKHRHMLLLLDNCEHLVDACVKLAYHLLQACPHLTLLATSREALNITGETAYRVPSMHAPDPNLAASLAEFAQVDSVRLFAERAEAVLPGFTLTDDVLPAVARICHRLDGIPLAIELAAARVQVLSVDQIAARLDDRFRLLTQGSRTAFPRQRTLRASIDWSYHLLSERERRLFQRLSVFSGGWTLEAAEAVCADFGNKGTSAFETGEQAGSDLNEASPLIRGRANSLDRLEESDILDDLTGLVAKSLVIADHRSGAETRYRMLETIRQYAQERLDEAGQGDTTRDCHLAYFLSLAETTGPLLHTPRIYELLGRLDLELDNLRAALAWALGKNNRSGAKQVLRILSSLFYFWWLRKLISETDGWMQPALDLIPDDAQSISLKAWSLLVLAAVKIRCGYFVREQLDHVNTCIALFRQVLHLPQNRLRLALALATRMDVIYRFLWFYPPEPPIQEDYARQDGEESFSLVQEFITASDPESRWIVAWVYLVQADYIGKAREPERVKDLKDTAHLLALGVGDQVVELNIFKLLSNLYLVNDPIKSQEYAQQGINLANRLGDPSSSIYFHERLGFSAYLTNQFEDMEIQFHKADSIFHGSSMTNLKWGETWITRMRAVAAVNQPDATRARSLLSEALKLAITNSDSNGVLSALVHFAGLALLLNQNLSAAWLLACIERQYEGFFKQMDQLPDRIEFEKHVKRVKGSLCETDFGVAWDKGRVMTLEQAITLATSIL